MTDQENFYRFCSIIVDHGKEALVILLDNDLSKQNLSFESFVNKHQHEIYHLHYVLVHKKLRCCQCPSGSSSQTGLQRVLHANQLDILLDEHGQKLPCHCISSTRPYCCSLAKPSVTTKELDITLARCLLVNFSTLCSSGSPIRRAVEVIVEYRNKSYGHALEAKMSASDFQKNVANLETAILIIAKVCNVENDMRQKLHDAKNRPLDQTLCFQYQNLLLQERNQKGEIEKSISVLQEQMHLMGSQLQSNHTRLGEEFQTHYQETTSMFSDIEIAQLDLKERTKVLENQVEDAKRRIQEDIQETSIKTVASVIETTKNVISEEIKADFQEASHLITKRFDSLERYQHEQHEELHSCVDQTERNVVASIESTGNVISEEIKGIRQNLDDCESRLQNHIDDGMLHAEKKNPTDQRKQNIITQANSLLTSHRKNECYVEPKAIGAGQILLNKHSIAIIVSKEGEGKTTTALQLATVYKNLGYRPYWFVDQDIRQFRDIIDPNDKCIIVMDDLFGRQCAEFEENIHRNILDILHAIVSNSHEMKLVLTINSDNNCLQSILTKHAILTPDFILDLDSQWKLSISEKKSIFFRYMEKFKISLCSCHKGMSFFEFYETNVRVSTCCDNDVKELSNKKIQICKGAISCILEMYISTGFPDTCRLFCSNPSFTLLGTSYFENPKQSLIDKIDALFVEGIENKIARYQYCLLVYTALKGHIELEYAENGLVRDGFFLDLFSIFDDNSLKLNKILIEALKKVNGKFLEEKTIYNSDTKTHALVFKHETISDAVLLSYGGENTSLEKLGIKFIYTYVRPNTNKRKKSSKTLQVPDTIICDRFKQILRKEQVKSSYLQAYDIGKYIRRSQMEDKNSVFIKTFFELVPISFFDRYQATDLFDALTQHGEQCEIIHPFLDKFGISICKYGSNKLIYSICRPQSSIVDPKKFILCPDEAMVKKLMYNILSHDREMISPLADIGEYLHSLSREENHNFVISFLSTISMKWDKRLSYEPRLIIGGFTNEGERKELIPIYRKIMSRFIPSNCSINIIFKFCRASIPDEECIDQFLLVDRTTLINQLTDMFRKCLFGFQLDYYCTISRERQVEEIGRSCYIFLSTMTDKSFLDEVVIAFVTVIQEKFSVKIGTDMNFYKISCQDPSLASSFFDGLTSFGEHLKSLREKFPKLIEILEKHTSFYSSLKKRCSSRYNDYFN